MSILKSDDRKKWTSTFVMLCSALIGYTLIRFMFQLGEWFDLESQVKYYLGISQVSGLIAGIIAFAAIMKNKVAYAYLDEVFEELVKVVWPEKDTVVKLTVGIVIAIAIVSAILLLIDWMARGLLSFVL